MSRTETLWGWYKLDNLD